MSLRDVALSFSEGAAPVLGPISLDLRQGEFLSLAGPSGCGKSTLLRLIAGLLVPTSGSISAGENSLAADNGFAALKSSEVRQPSRSHAARVGFVFQHPTLLPWRTALQNLSLPLELGKQASVNRSDVSRYMSLLKQVGLAEADASKRPGELSGGMQMRLSLARALATDPQLLLLDEPLAAVDDLMRIRLQQDISRIHADQKLSSVLVTHNLHEAIFMSDRVLVLGGSPTRIVEEIVVPEAQPRSAEFRQTPLFGELVQKLASALFGSEPVQADVYP